MRHAILFLVGIFAVLFLAHLNRTESLNSSSNVKVLRVFGYSSFAGKWGPGPILKAMFEKTCDCRVEYIEGSDSGILLQRLKIEGESLGVDMIVGLDQFDIAKAQADHQWRKLVTEGIAFEEQIIPVLTNTYFVPFDWGILTFIGRQSGSSVQKLDELVDGSWTQRISLQDPRTSSPGMQFLNWVMTEKPGAAGYEYLAKLMKEAHSFSPTWSGSYGLFSKKQTDLVFSYVTSPLYHQIEEKDSGYVAFQMKEPHPMQVEFLGIPDFCRNCELAEKFAALMLSPEGQKVIMEKNYMFPVVKGVKEGTVFDIAKNYSVQKNFKYFSQNEVEKMLKAWSVIRRGDIPE